MSFWRKLFPDYKSLSGYLHRTTLLKVGRLHVRLHHIMSDDATPFMHTHPFSYVSLVLRGGYTEQLESKVGTYRRGSVLVRKHSDFHRLSDVDPKTVTLIFCWSVDGAGWNLRKSKKLHGTCSWQPPEHAGVYVRRLYGKDRFCLFDEFWRTAADSPEQALVATKPSIDQTTQGTLHSLLP